MLNLLKQNKRLNETIFLMGVSFCCLAFSLFRCFYTGSIMFFFLNWNLFLAFVPWFLTSLAIIKPQYFQHKGTIILLLFSWLLFFPNAPYILTDIFHLRRVFSMPVWFDTILIISFAWVGLVFGFLSLWDIETLLSRFMNKCWVHAIAVFLLLLAAFGIYLGRYLRFNSWDILTDPFNLLGDIGDRLINPYKHPRSWGMTLFMGVFLNMVYWSLVLMRKRGYDHNGS
ncbi:MAG: DUF1361 domain-containing protein [Bacteroidota bacterium]